MQNQTIIEAQTYTCHYIEREDRLLLTINYQDVEKRIDFWITRAFLVKLLPYFFDYVTVEKEETTNDKYATNPTDNSTFALTQQKPILLESIDFEPLKNKGMKIVLKNLENNIFCIAVLDNNIFKSFVELLTKTAPSFDWGIANII